VLITFAFRSDTVANFTALNRIYDLGEPLYETDTKRFRIGDGVTPYASLPVQSVDTAALTALSNAAVAAATDAETARDEAVAAAGGATAATLTSPGVVRLATTAEATTGTDDTIAVTPAGLEAAIAGLTGAPAAATTTVQGIVELATNTEAATGTDTVRAVTPAGVAAAIAALGVATPDATATVKGKVELATDAEAIAGTDTVRATTPANLKATIDARVASTTAPGIVELATNAETLTGTDTARAVTPAGLAAVKATLGSVTVANISDATTPGRNLLTAASAPAQVGLLGLADVARVDTDNDFTGSNTFPAGSIDPAALGALDQIITDYNLANRIVSFRTYAFGTTPAVTPNTLWGELASGVTPTPTDTLITHQGSTVDAATYSFDPGAIPAASVYTLAITGGNAAVRAACAAAVSGRSLTWAPALDRSVTDAATTSGSATLTSATANFQATDVGKVITGPGIPAGTVISARASTTSITLSANATATATGVSVSWGGGISSNGVLSLIFFRGTGTPDSSGNITVTFPISMQGCHIELVATSSVQTTPVDVAYNGQGSGFAAPTVDMGNAPNSAHHQIAALAWNSASSTITTDPGTPFGTSPNISTTTPALQSRSSLLATPVQVVNWAKSDSSQEVTGAIIYQP
jgi:hypothetical protein